MRRAFICPSKYVQGENELRNLGYFVRQYGTTALLVATKSSVARVSETLNATAEKFGVTFVATGFQGECSRDEIARLGELARQHASGDALRFAHGLPGLVRKFVDVHMLPPHAARCRAGEYFFGRRTGWFPTLMQRFFTPVVAMQTAFAARLARAC